MIQKAMVGKAGIGIALALGLCLVSTLPADAGRGFGGGGGMGIRGGGGGFSGTRGGFSGTRGGFVVGGFHGNRFHGGHGFHGNRCCVNGVFVSGFVFGSFPAPYYVYPYPYPYWDPPYPSPQPAPQLDFYMPAVAPRTDLGPSIPREACYASGCYRLQGDGVTVAYQWVWVPAPPPPPAVIPYPTGRYELRGPSRWEWVPNSSSGPAVSPGGPPSSRPAESGPAALSAHGLVRWVDDKGVTHWTQGLDAVPERYRPRAKPGATAGAGETL